MSLPDGIKIKSLRAVKPAKNEMDKFLGKTLTMMCGTPVLIEKIVGSVFRPTRFEVNGLYHIVILDAYKQLNRDQSITPQMIRDFDEAVHFVEKAPNREAPGPVANDRLPKLDKDVIDGTPLRFKKPTQTH